MSGLSTYTYADFWGSLWAVVVFTVVLLCPGYVVAWGCNLFAFRTKCLAERILWAVTLSFALMTITAVLLAKYTSLATDCWLAGLLGVTALVLTGRDAVRGQLRIGLGTYGRMACLGMTVWILLAVIELIDIGLGSKLYMSLTIYDHALRTAFIDAVVRTGVPPSNPLYWTGHGAPMRYYYFWYVLCAVVVKLGHVSARQALVASCVWGGFGLGSILALYVRYFAAGDRATARTRVYASLGVLLVTGLDLLTIMFVGIPGDLEWWSIDPVISWTDSLLWAPHHIAGLVCCLLGFLLIWQVKTAGRPWLSALLAGMAFASAFGLSIWMALGFAMIMVCWAIWAIVRANDWRRVGVLAGAALIGSVLAAPYIGELRYSATEGSGPQLSRHLLTVEPRRMINPDILINTPGFKQLRIRNAYWEDQLAALTLMPAGYLIEFGFFALVLVVTLRRWRTLDEAGQTALVLTVSCLLITSFVRSTVIRNNDFGYRVVLIAQFFLVLMALDLMTTWSGWTRGLGSVLLIIGIAGTTYQAVILRVLLPIAESQGRPELARLAETNMALRTALSELDTRVPQDAVIAYKPPGGSYGFTYTANLNRQTVNATPGCNTSFGGDGADCAGIEGELAQIYAGGSGSDAQKSCARLDAQYLLVTKWDAIWQNSGSWVWSLPAVVATPSARVLSCGASG